MRIAVTHLHALLHLKRVIEQVQALEQLPLTDRERDVVRESLERAYDRAEFLLTPEIMQALTDKAMEGEDADASLVPFP